MHQVHILSVYRRIAVGCLLAAMAGEAVVAGDVTVEPPDFNLEIRPILSQYCLGCHGRDDGNRQAGVRLDRRESATTAAESGQIPIVPGDPDASELVRRIESHDPSEVMPPADSNKVLTQTQKQLLRRWVETGAAYEEHWAFAAPYRYPPPDVKDHVWPRNPIDNFILSRLESVGLGPSPEADRSTLFRRLSLDLTGLPPSSDDFAAFDREMSVAQLANGESSESSEINEQDRSSAADRVYAKWVDKLLSSPHYGERMAVDWLDAARFADTNGYQVDRDREMYAWRDWVIGAFNLNMSFDQFTIEQLAGDLLPNATLDQRIATGFHRNHMLNEEGGVIPEEFLAEYCADRVETTATVWLGQTFLCARCHDHKYDPFTQKDYYSLYAFFHNVSESGLGNYGANIRRNAPPILQLPAPELEAKKATLEQNLADVNKHLEQRETAIASSHADWERRAIEAAVTWQTGEPIAAQLGEASIDVDREQRLVRITPSADGQIRCEIQAAWPGSSLSRMTAMKLDVKPVAMKAENTDAGTQSMEWRLDQLRVSTVAAESTDEEAVSLRAAEVEGSLPAEETARSLDASTKQSTLISQTDDGASLVIEFEPITIRDGTIELRLELSFTVPENSGPCDVRIDATDASTDLLLPAEIAQIVRTASEDRTAEQAKQLVEFRKSKDAEHRQLTERSDALTKEIDETDLQIPTALVMDEMTTPRETHILVRGVYSNKGDQVTAGTPAALPAMSPELPRNRLGLAKWIAHADNPLTSRVAVNRMWQSLFGAGLVRTAEDFGVQGEPPSHPDLLDWLATEFVRSGWDVKAMMRLIVTSSTYRQSSRLNPQLHAHDPDNRLLARGARFRLQAEFLRDQALAASGLLVPTIGGPSVKPYHPPGLYEQVVAGSSAATYVVGAGTDLYRRSLYTYWKRSVPNPAMLVFDAPFREQCTMRRSRTNTPLQALNLMNDETYVEAARFLALRMVSAGGESAQDRIRHGFRLVLVRSPSDAEMMILMRAYERSIGEFGHDPVSATGLLAVGESTSDLPIEQAQLAALTMAASTILNLDETLNKE